MIHTARSLTVRTLTFSLHHVLSAGGCVGGESVFTCEEASASIDLFKDGAPYAYRYEHEHHACTSTSTVLLV